MPCGSASRVAGTRSARASATSRNARRITSSCTPTSRRTPSPRSTRSCTNSTRAERRAVQKKARYCGLFLNKPPDLPLDELVEVHHAVFHRALVGAVLLAPVRDQRAPALGHAHADLLVL